MGAPPLFAAPLTADERRMLDDALRADRAAVTIDPIVIAFHDAAPSEGAWWRATMVLTIIVLLLFPIRWALT